MSHHYLTGVTPLSDPCHTLSDRCPIVAQVATRRNYPVCLTRASYKTYGKLFTEHAVQMRCMADDHSLGVSGESGVGRREGEGSLGVSGESGGGQREAWGSVERAGWGGEREREVWGSVERAGGGTEGSLGVSGESGEGRREGEGSGEHPASGVLLKSSVEYGRHFDFCCEPKEREKEKKHSLLFNEDFCTGTY